MFKIIDHLTLVDQQYFYDILFHYDNKLCLSQIFSKADGCTKITEKQIFDPFSSKNLFFQESEGLE